MQFALRLSDVVQRPLVSRGGEKIGRVDDLAARLSDSGYPVIMGLVVRVGGRELFVPAGETAGLEGSVARLRVDRLDMRSFERRPSEILLRRDLLGRRVINVAGARLVRVGDVVLKADGDLLQVIGVSVAPSGAWARPRALFHRDHTDPVIDWASLEPFVGHVPTVGRRPLFARIAHLHPAELADIVESASHPEGEEIMTAVAEDPALEADVFEELTPEYQVEFLQARSDSEAASILANMTPDDAADLLQELDGDRRERLMVRLPMRQLLKVKTLLGYHPDTAGGLMSPDFPRAHAETPVEDALEMFRVSGLHPPSALTLIVTGDGGALIGVVTLIDLLRADQDADVGSLIEHDPVWAEPFTDLPGVARKLTDFNLVALPVVDEDHRVLGVVTVDDVLDAMLPSDWRALTRDDAVVQHPVRGQDEDGS